MSLTGLLREVRACQFCSANLPLGPRAVLQQASSARLLIIGQAPESKSRCSRIRTQAGFIDAGDKFQSDLTNDAIVHSNGRHLHEPTKRQRGSSATYRRRR
jgi:uracil-DNA glycosylase